MPIYPFPAILALPVADDTDDTIPVCVTARVDRCEDGTVLFAFDATVAADAFNEDGIAYAQGQVIRADEMMRRNLDQLERAYLTCRETDELI